VEFVLVLVVLAVAVWVIAAPLRRPRADEPEPDSARQALEAARDAKYREIRDADLDHRTGKLSDPDFAALDATLRAEAVEILRELDARDGAEP
jgi:hypothetical protein